MATTMYVELMQNCFVGTYISKNGVQMILRDTCTCTILCIGYTCNYMTVHIYEVDHCTLRFSESKPSNWCGASCSLKGPHLDTNLGLTLNTWGNYKVYTFLLYTFLYSVLPMQ